MRKIIFVFCLCILLLISLCSCENNTTQDSNMSTNSFNESSNNSNVTIDEESKGASYNKDEFYPLLFIDPAESSNEAYVLCYLSSGKLYTNEEFKYNNNLLTDYIDSDAVEVSTDIFDSSKALKFYDSKGTSLKTQSNRTICHGETLLGTAHVCVELSKDVLLHSNRFFGTYDGIDIFPQNADYQDSKILVDINSDNKNDLISWELIPADAQTYGENYYLYSIKVVVDEQTYIIENNDWPIEKNDFEIFVADVDLNGKNELIIYEKAMSRFNSVSIYDFNSGTQQLLFSYTITPEP